MENATVCKFEPDKNPCDYIPQMLYVKESIQWEAFPDRGTLRKDEGVNTWGWYYSLQSLCPQYVNFKM